MDSSLHGITPLRQRMIDDGTVKLTAKVRKYPGRHCQLTGIMI